MEDPNLIAWLFPAKSSEGDGKYTWDAINMNKSRYIPPQIPPQEVTRSDFRSRESTTSLEDAEDQLANYTSYPGLQLTFNHGPKAGYGFVFGTDPSCDIILPQLSSISRRHCALTFDTNRRLVLQDFSSRGTVVTYNDKGNEMRRRFTWILGGDEAVRRSDNIILEIKGIKFKIIVSTHDTHLELYNSSVDKFLQDADAYEVPFGALGIRSTSSTAAPSGSYTPSQRPIRLEQEELGTGAFAVVKRFWDVSTGSEYAYKEPRNKKKLDRKMWEKEANIMSQVSHDHVVKLVEALFTPWPLLILEYVPFGSLEDQTNLSVKKCVAILCQGLSALVHLHEREVPIVHRDIKPGNILVQSQDPLHIKLTDFGLSRASNDLTTICGTLIYLAPEVHKKERYTPVVDIWSLGLVVFAFSYGLPVHNEFEKHWCERIIEKANDLDSEDLIDFLSTAMLVMKPKLRHSAKMCLERVLQLSVPSLVGNLTPTPTSYGEGYEATVIGSPNWRSSQHDISNPLPQIQECITIDPPTSNSYTSTSAGTRTKSKRPSKSSSSSGRRHTKRHGKVTAGSSSSQPQREESEPALDLFGEGWLQDPNCVGSSIAAIGEEPSNWSSWDDLETEPAERSTPRSIQKTVGERNDDYDPDLTQGGDAVVEDAYLADTVANDGTEGGWTDSEACMAADILRAIREDERH